MPAEDRPSPGAPHRHLENYRQLRDTERGDFLARVERVCRLRLTNEASIERRRIGAPPLEYLNVSVQHAGFDTRYPIGASEHGVDERILQRFLIVHRHYRETDPGVTSRLIYAGPPASAALIHRAVGYGVRLTRFTDYQELMDFGAYLREQNELLANDPAYPSSLYVPQRMRYRHAQQLYQTGDALVALQDWLHQPRGRFILILGDFGAGKSFLLHELARRLAEDTQAPIPILIPIHALEKLPSVDGLVARHLAQFGMARIYPKAFRYMLEQGRIVLLLDGFDELAMRVTYARATEHLRTLIAAAVGNAKILVTSRKQYFESEQQIKSALGERVERLASRRVTYLESFDNLRIRRFLGNLLQDGEQARARFDLIARVEDLMGLSANPRMLSFIAELPAADLRAARNHEGHITAASLYRLLLDRWLGREYERTRSRDGAPGLSKRERWIAVTRLALTLWRRPEPKIDVAVLTGEMKRIIAALTQPRPSVGQVAHQVGSGTLLVNDMAGNFGFIHHSVLEWLVANHAAGEMRRRGESTALAVRSVSLLMVDFLADLAGKERLLDWAHRTFVDAGASEHAKQNALLTLERLEAQTELSLRLRGQDLRGRDLSNRRLAGIDLSGADLDGARLIGSDLSGAKLVKTRLRDADLSAACLRRADLRDADLYGARLLGADLRGARLESCSLRRGKLVGAVLEEGALASIGDSYGCAVPHPAAIDVLAASASPCNAVAWSPGGEWLASGHDDGGLRLWDVAARHEIRRFAGHDLAAMGVAFSPDGMCLASGSDDATVRLWQLDNAAELACCRGHDAGVMSVAFSPDGRRLASASEDATVRVWSLDGTEQTRCHGHRAGVMSVAFSPDGTRLASGADDETVRLWSADDGKELLRLTGHQDRVWSVAFSPDGTRLASGSWDGTVRIWSLADSSELLCCRGHEGWVMSVALSSDGTRLLSGADDGTVRLWDALSGTELLCWHGHEGWVMSVAFSPDGNNIVSGSDDHTVRIWSAPDGAEQARLIGLRSGSLDVAFSPNGQRLASGCEDGLLRLWSLAGAKELVRCQASTGRVASVAFNPDGKYLATGGEDKMVRLWSLAAQEIACCEGHEGEVMDVAFSPDGRYLASAGDDGTARLWPAAGGAEQVCLQDHEGSVRCLVFTPGSERLATGADDGTIRLWTPDGAELAWLHGHEDRVRSVAFSPDGRYLASAGDDETLRLWPAAGGQELVCFRGHRDRVSSVVFSPNGKCLASGSRDRTVRLWALSASGEQIACLRGHGARVTEVAFSPDGRYLASAAADNTIRVWDIASGCCLAMLVHLPQGWLACAPDGRYKMGGEVSGGFWHIVGLCRFEPGELDPYLPVPLRMPDDEVLVPGV